MVHKRKAMTFVSLLQLFHLHNLDNTEWYVHERLDKQIGTRAPARLPRFPYCHCFSRLALVSDRRPC